MVKQKQGPKARASQMSDQEMELGDMLIAKQTFAECAEALGIQARRVEYLSRLPRMKKYIHDQTERTLAMRAKEKAKLSSKAGLATMEDAARRLWELAQLAPEETKGSITGQIEAIAKYCELMSFNGERADGEPKVTFYQSAWMREAAEKPTQ